MNMNALKNLASAVALTTVSVAGGALATSSAAIAQQAQQSTPQGWFKTCRENDGTQLCTTQQVRTASTGQLVTAIALIQISGKQTAELIQVSVPSGRQIPPGIGMSIDGGKETKIPYFFCLQDRSVAEIRLTKELIASMKKGGELTLTSVNFRRQPNPVKMTLNGFTAAIDGPPLDQKDVIENQKKLQQELAAKAEEARKKLEEAQQKAKEQ